jgi:hypothetical protein
MKSHVRKPKAELKAQNDPVGISILMEELMTLLDRDRHVMQLRLG